MYAWSPPKADVTVLIHQAKRYWCMNVTVCLTVVSQQGLSRTLRIWAGCLCAASAGETNAAVGAAVTLTPHRHVAPIYTPLMPQKHSNLEVQSTMLPVSWIVNYSAGGKCSNLSLTVSVCAPMDSKRAESWTILSIAPEREERQT